MENNNASATPSVAPNSTTPTNPTPSVAPNPTVPTSSTPTQSSVNATAPVAKKSNKKVIIIIACIVGVCILLSVISYALARGRLNKTVSVCEEHGLFSTQCKEAQKENNVNCDLKGYCSTKYFIIF